MLKSVCSFNQGSRIVLISARLSCFHRLSLIEEVYEVIFFSKRECINNRAGRQADWQARRGYWSWRAECNLYTEWRTMLCEFQTPQSIFIRHQGEMNSLAQCYWITMHLHHSCIGRREGVQQKVSPIRTWSLGFIMNLCDLIWPRY